MAKLKEKIVKEYFKEPGTVSQWWELEGNATNSWSERDRYIVKKERMDTSRLIEPKDKVILDCAAGKGRNAIALAKEGAKLVVAMDISREMLEIAKGRAKKEGLQDKIIFVVGDAEKISFPDNYFNMRLFAYKQ